MDRQNLDEPRSSNPSAEGGFTVDDIGRTLGVPDGEVDITLALFDPDAELRPLPGDGRVFRGRDAIEEWLSEVARWMVYRPNQMRSAQLADDTYVFTGRLQWMEDQQLRDEQVVWLVELREGRVWRSTALRNAQEAEEAYRSRDRG